MLKRLSCDFWGHGSVVAEDDAPDFAAAAAVAAAWALRARAAASQHLIRARRNGWSAGHRSNGVCPRLLRTHKSARPVPASTHTTTVALGGGGITLLLVATGEVGADRDPEPRVDWPKRFRLLVPEMAIAALNAAVRASPATNGPVWSSTVRKGDFLSRRQFSFLGLLLLEAVESFA